MPDRAGELPAYPADRAQDAIRAKALIYYPYFRLVYLESIRFPDYILSVPSGVAVGKLHQIGKLIIRVYANDHLPPHFHVIAPDFEALIEIETLTIMRGRLSPQTQRAVMTWAARNRTAIAREWNRINPRFPIAEGQG